MAIINGTPGDDFLGGTSGDDQINGFGGNDFLSGLGGNDLLDGGDGHDFLRGDDGDDSLLGGSGDDYLRGGLGNDLIDGGTGWDRIAFFTAANGVTVDLGIQGVAQDTGVGFDTLVGIEHASGTAFADVLIGNAGDNWLWGEKGDDQFSGGGGNDLIVAGLGNASADGGTGIDTFSVWDNSEPYASAVTLSLLLQGMAQATGIGTMNLTGFENLSGSAVADTLIGDAGANVLAGDTGDDTLEGGDGNDTLYGDGRIIVDTHETGRSGPIATYADITTVYPLTPGNDTLEGGGGNDLLDGGGGSDTASYASASGPVFVNLTTGSATGAAGNDTLVSIENVTGSAFADTFTGSNLTNLLSGGGGDDQMLGLGSGDTLDGGDGNDVLRGDGFSNYNGASGDDTLNGGNGDDILWGGAGTDSYDGGAGTDRVSFFAMAATQGAVASLLTQTVGNDGFGNSETMVSIENLGAGTAFADHFTGDNNANFMLGDRGDTLLGLDGDDSFQLTAAPAFVDGGAGIDTITGFFGQDVGSLVPDTDADGLAELVVATSGVHVDLGLGQIVDDGFGHSGTLTGIENVGGSSLADTLIGDGGANVLSGFAGDDTLEGAGGNDTLEGGDGSDTASYASASGAVTLSLNNSGGGGASGAAGSDVFSSIENLTGSAHDDTILGNAAANRLSGGGGHDLMRGLGGDDAMSGGDGDDYLDAGDGDDSVDGGAGIDRMSFFSGATAGVTVDLNLQGAAQNTGRGMKTLIGIEQLSGTDFADVLTGDGADNWLWGNSGDDTIAAGGGNDFVQVVIGNHVADGGAGTDTLSLHDNGTGLASGGATVSLALQGAPQATGMGSKTLTGFENLSGTSYTDGLTGDSGANVLAGALGDDTLSGGDGADALYGDGQFATTRAYAGGGAIILYADIAATLGGVAGNDTLEGGGGNDLLDGGGGSDTASYASAPGPVFVNLATGSASGAAGNDTLVSIENATGSAHDDTLTGSGGTNVLKGLGGDDFLRGEGGDDTLEGGEGDDVIRGGAGNDQISGGNGDDHLRGNEGVDHFDGGADSGVPIAGVPYGDRISFFEVTATQGVVADLRTGIISNDGFGNAETMVGIESLGADTAFADTLHGDDGRNALLASKGDFLHGHGGDDLFYIAAAAAVVDGGAGIDVLEVLSNGTWLLPDSNSDGIAEAAPAMSAGWTVDLAAGTLADGYGNTGSVSGIENVTGSLLADTIVGDAGQNLLMGGDGNDLIEGGAGNDTLDGGDGSDTARYASAGGAVTVILHNSGSGSASGAAGADSLLSIENVTGSAHDDTIRGNDFANVVAGGGGHDFMRGLGGDDSVSGGDGDDYLDGGDGDDLLDGGSGIDRVSYYSTAAAGVTVDLGLAGPQNTGRGMDTLVGIEQVSGTAFADVLTGSGGDNWLVALEGNDAVSAGGGNDLVHDSTGTDALDGGTGTDTLALDDFGLAGLATGFTVSLALQGGAQNSGHGMKTLSGFENLSGSALADTLAGDAGANVLAGALGNDVLSGGDGNDRLYGDGRYGPVRTVAGGGAIVLHADVAAEFGGVAGNDTLDGGKGNDLIVGGGGDDLMSGGAGDDTFVVGTGSGDDRITDLGKKDLIAIVGVAGIDDFSDLTIVNDATGKNAVISWGGSDSVTLEGIRASKVTASMFVFTEPAAASFAAFSASGPAILPGDQHAF